jgi:8-oxo-dGTP diphosphatase
MVAKATQNNPFAATDLVIPKFRDGKMLVYLVKISAEHSKGKWALPGALIKNDETLEQAAIRVFFEASNAKQVTLEQLYTFSDPKRDPRNRSISTAYLAFADNPEKFTVCSKYLEGKWFDVKEMPKLAYDHNQILNVALERIAAKLNYSTIGFFVLNKEFTLSEFQSLYEYFAKNPIDKRNFRKKVLTLNIVKETGKMVTDKIARPAKIYKSVSNKIEILSLIIPYT